MVSRGYAFWEPVNVAIRLTAGPRTMNPRKCLPRAEANQTSVRTGLTWHHHKAHCESFGRPAEPEPASVNPSRKYRNGSRLSP